MLSKFNLVSILIFLLGLVTLIGSSLISIKWIDLFGFALMVVAVLLSKANWIDVFPRFGIMIYYALLALLLTAMYFW